MDSKQRLTPALVWEGAERPRIAPGEYTARCTDFQGPQWAIAFGSWKLRLEFALDPDDVKVSVFYALGENRSTPHIGTRSKYYKDWVRANGGPPTHGQEMTPNVFLDPDLCFTVLVGDCTKDAENLEKHPALVYSQVKKIIEVKRLSTQEDMQASG
jgi:hypothetical protein